MEQFNGTDLAKRGQVMRTLVRDVRAHQLEFKEALPMRIVSAKFYKLLERNGGFHRALEELMSDGTLTLVRERSGRQLVRLG